MHQTHQYETFAYKQSLEQLSGEIVHHPVIVVVTGVIEPKLARDLLTRGVDDIFFKPVNHKLLAVKLFALLQHRQCVLADGPEDSGE